MHDKMNDFRFKNVIFFERTMQTISIQTKPKPNGNEAEVDRAVKAVRRVYGSDLVAFFRDVRRKSKVSVDSDRDSLAAAERALAAVDKAKRELSL